MSRLAIPNNHQPTGFILVVVSIITASLLLLANYLLSQSISETRISKSENAASKSYYLAEAGVNEAIFKLKNDNTWKTKFLAGTLNNDTASRSQVFDNYGSYTISATSISPALADITITANYQIGDKTAKRVIKTRLARATNEASDWELSMYGGGTGGGENGKITFTGGRCTVNNGTLQANQNFKVTSGAKLTANHAAIKSNNNIIVNSGGQIICNECTQEEGVATIAMPQVDFDSTSPTSLKNRANQTYTSTQFAALPSGTTLNGITFVTGNATISAKNMTINGILAASGNITITMSGSNTVTVNSGTSGSGVLAKNDIIVTMSGSTVNVNGLMYASHAFTVTLSGTPSFTITGGLIGWHVTVTGSGSPNCTITYDAELAYGPLDPIYNGNESPIIEINHWEEQY